MKNQNKTVIPSDVSAVTVYSDRALVTRKATFSANAGSHKYVFDNLPDAIEQNSIQVNGKGEAILRDIKFSEVFFSDVPDEKVKCLLKEQQRIEDDMTAVEDKIQQASKEKEFIDSIARKLTSQSKGTNSGELDPEKWVNMVEFYRKKLVELDQEIRNAEQRQRKLENELEKVSSTISNLGNANKQRNQVEVVVEVSQETRMTLELSYIVYGPGWTPYYDLRVDSDNKIMDVTYNALIRQNTAESWNDVSVFLSTAQPNINGHQPELSPWYLDVYTETDNLEGRSVADSSPIRKRKENIAQMMESGAGEIMADIIMQAPSMSKPATTVESMATSVVFKVEGNNTIANDGDDHKVTILMQSFPANFRYSCVPKMSPYAYLKAQVKNISEYPFLPGDTNIFLDKNFVATSYMDLVVPDEEFWTYLGIDEGIKVEHKFLKRKQKNAGVFNKTKNYVYEYQIELQNNKKNQEEIVVWDQLPISNHDKIEVKLMSPELTEKNKSFKMNEFKYLEWLYKPVPGEKIQIPLMFSVEYPQEMNVTGL